VIGEGNSVSQGGAANISDVFGSALWAADFLCEISKVGATRHNFHGGLGGHYTMLGFDSAQPAARLQARPLYYGALAFSTLVANYSRWVSSTWSVDPERHSGQPVPPDESTTMATVAQHAAVDVDGRLKVLLIGKELGAGQPLPFSVRVVGGASRYEHRGGVAVARMLPNAAKGAMSKYGDGITFAGQTWDNSSDGAPVSERLAESVDVLLAPGGQDLVVEIQVGRVSAALLTFEPHISVDSVDGAATGRVPSTQLGHAQ
jgi:hypothetical protein